MKLRTQFSLLTAGVTILSVLFIVFFFGIQREPRDPRAPTRDFTTALSERWRSGEAMTTKTIKATAESVGMPLGEVALLSHDGKVLASTFMHIAEGSQIKLDDLAPQPRSPRGEPTPELKIMSLDASQSDSPFVVFDVRPFWSRQDIRNRNILFIGTFALLIFVVVTIFSVLILRSISKSINMLEEDAAIVATGDLDHEVRGPGNYELQHLAKSINLMRLTLKDMLARRSKMLMGISHDLKTPIALIQGYADALQDNVAGDKETTDKYVAIIQDKAKQLEDLTGDLIDFMKIGGDGTVSVENVDPAELLRSLGTRFQSDSQLLGRSLCWGFGEDYAEVPDFPIVSMPMNKALVERAIENLVTNSLKYSSKEGHIGLRLLRIDNAYAFSVTDDGPGIPESDEPYVFDAFYRGSHSRSDSGHGFGLTIVKAVADLHGWTTSIGKRRDGKPGTEALLRLGRVAPSSGSDQPKDRA
ncbi:MAG: HAMP domain-containing histidine kinase [Spirochaetaceae bacterium]|nr:HAMP domain-containing histidine kinase [Spirochaetaceae bacterium]